MKIQEAKDLQAACHRAACQLNEAISNACREGMVIQIELTERETTADSSTIVSVWPNCTVNPKYLEV